MTTCDIFDRAGLHPTNVGKSFFVLRQQVRGVAMRAGTYVFVGALCAFLSMGQGLAADYCDQQPSEIAKARCRATGTSRNIPEDIARAEAGATHISWVYWAAPSPDGSLLASAGKDQTVKLWDFASGKFIRNLGKHDGWVRRVAFRKDGKAVYAIADNEGLSELDVDTGKTLRTAPLPPGANKEWFDMRLSPDGRFLALTSLERGVQLWDVDKWAPDRRLADNEYISRIVFSPTSSALVAAGEKYLTIWNPLDGDPSQIPIPEEVAALAFSPDGSKLILGGEETVEIWDLGSGKLETSFPTKELPKIFDLAMTPDNSIVITCTDAPAAFDAKSGKLLKVFGEMTDNCHSVAITKDGKFAVTSHMGSDIRVWDIATGTLTRRFGEAVVQP
ncbi:WD40 repeat domain-containing protein [Methylovirgula sp. 4M-Z18]|uniref:WD40 repeat domain-containing protein n=1 Tax=Methylovirgula sp. 4M-Z18 TaxID=2293567 RepID=UPI001314348B|nr:hypothetical protein [Methylovirgula sp. 4M-Z18]